MRQRGTQRRVHPKWQRDQAGRTVSKLRDHPLVPGAVNDAEACLVLTCWQAIVGDEPRDRARLGVTLYVLPVALTDAAQLKDSRSDATFVDAGR